MTEQSLKRANQITKDLQELYTLQQNLNNEKVFIKVKLETKEYFICRVPDEFIISDVREVIELRLNRKIEALTKEFKNL